jgi:hypothetical protein
MDKPTTTYTNSSENAAGFMLKEDTFHLLLETGFRIVLAYGTDYTNETKPVTSY